MKPISMNRHFGRASEQPRARHANGARRRSGARESVSGSPRGEAPRTRLEEYAIPVPLASGTRLGPFEIVAPLRAGGMGDVYKATDTRLDRTVAIKGLPALLASD